MRMRRVAVVLIAACMGLSSANEPPSPAGTTGACIALGDASDLQLMPSCSLKKIITNAMAVIRPFFQKFPFENKATCYDKTAGLVYDVADATFLPCIYGNCSNIFGMVMSALYPPGQGLDELQKMSQANLTGNFKSAFEYATKDIRNETLKMVCPEAGERPPFMTLLPQTLNTTDISLQVLNNIENVLGMLFNDPAMAAKSTDDCRFFKENLEGVFTSVDAASIINTLVPKRPDTVMIATVLAGGHIKQAQQLISNELEELFCKAAKDDKEAVDQVGGASMANVATGAVLGCCLMALARLM